MFFQFYLVDPGDAIQSGYLRVRRGSQVHPPKAPRGVGRDGNLLLSARRSVQRLAWHAQMVARRTALWWRAKRGIHVFLRVIWRDAMPGPSGTKLTISFFLHNAFVNNNNNKWITHTIPVR